MWCVAVAVCQDDETEVKTRWVYTQSFTCAQLIGGISDVYNPDFRYDCQWALKLASLPHSIEKSYVTNCFLLQNGTVKYRAKICCKGTRRAHCWYKYSHAHTLAHSYTPHTSIFAYSQTRALTHSCSHSKKVKIKSKVPPRGEVIVLRSTGER